MMASRSPRTSPRQTAASVGAAALVLALALGSSPAWAGSVEIRVTLPDGRPARDVRLFLEERRGRTVLSQGAMTGSEGRARFADLSPGTYHLIFRPWPYRDLVRPDENPYLPLEPVTLVRPEDEVFLEVPLMAGVPVAVSVHPSDGEPKYFSAAFRNLETGLILHQRFDRGGIRSCSRAVSPSGLRRGRAVWRRHLHVAAPPLGRCRDRPRRADAVSDPGPHLSRQGVET